MKLVSQVFCLKSTSSIYAYSDYGRTANSKGSGRIIEGNSIVRKSVKVNGGLDA